MKEAGGDRDIRRRFVRVSDVTDEVESLWYPGDCGLERPGATEEEPETGGW